MFRHLLPRETSFFDFFEQHGVLDMEACHELFEMVSGGADGIARADRIKELERQADVITHACTDALHKTFITPFDRSEIHKLIQRLDDIIDSVESIATRLVLYDMVKETRPEARALGDVLVRASREIAEALPHLRDMRNPEDLKRHCVTLFTLENEGDALMRSALARLFREETDAVTLIKWKEIYERLEKAVDRCEAVASIVQGILIEST